MRKLSDYQFKLDGIPEAHREFFVHANETMAKAYNNPGKMYRDFAGQYYIVANDELMSVSYRGDEFRDWIIVHEYNGYTDWYSDPYRTLREIKEAYCV